MDWHWLQEPGVCGLLLTGSQARGEADAYSDIDVLRFWTAKRSRSHRLEVQAGRLLSVTDLALEDAYAELGYAPSWIWAAGGFRQARVLLDPDGAMAKLKQAADGDAPEGRDWASQDLVGWCEEVGKLLGALATGDPERGHDARFSLVRGMSVLMAVQHSVAVLTENRFYSQVRDEVGGEWALVQQQALGGDVRAALRLFQVTAELFPSHPVVALTLQRLRGPCVRPLQPEHREVYGRMRQDLWPDCEPDEMDLLLDPDTGLDGALRYQGFLAEDPLSGEALGIVELGLYPEGRGHIDGLYVAPAHRERGVGQALVEWAIGELSRWGCSAITSDTWSHQQTSRRLHQRCGFVVVDEDEDEVRFRLVRD